YTAAPNSTARRSAQTALFHITHALLKLMAPILSFTAEEAWKDLHHNQASTLTIFTELFHTIPTVDNSKDLCDKWARLRTILAVVMRRIEDGRSTGQVGSSLAAEVDIYADGDDYELLNSLSNDLRFVMIVSRATLHQGELRIEVKATQAEKCERCWHH